MPRVSKEAKAASHARIVEEAARQFREKGIEATGVADVMKAAGFTHGGFYRHFNSKDDLAAAAITLAFDDILIRLEAAVAKGDNRAALREFVNQLLSEQHVANPGMGCPIVALGAEASRGSNAERDAIAQGIERTIDRLAEVLGENGEDARLKASGLLSLLVGTVVLARSAPSVEMIREVLESGRCIAMQSLKS